MNEDGTGPSVAESQHGWPYVKRRTTFTDNGKREQYLGDESGLIMDEVQRANEDEANDQLTRPHL
ncbi:MAG: hypothetical protein Q9190_004268 [Brigantiaea leucoxantha]